MEELHKKAKQIIAAHKKGHITRKEVDELINSLQADAYFLSI